MTTGNNKVNLGNFFDLSTVPDIEDIVTKKIRKSEVISASRRTDIPAFYMDLMVNAMIKEEIDVISRYGQKSTISLSPKHVKCFAWWSKDYGKWIETYKLNRQLFDKFAHIFNFTLTGSDELECGVKTSLDERLYQAKYICKHFGSNTLIYRFDPIVPYIDVTTGERKINLDNFKKITKTLVKYGVNHVIIAFCISYPKVAKRMLRHEKELLTISKEEKFIILDQMIEIADKYGMKICACCSDEILGYKNKIFPAKCIDGNIIEDILYSSLKHNIKDKGQRINCGCVSAIDIGSYTLKCGHNCLYCYANPNIY